MRRVVRTMPAARDQIGHAEGVRVPCVREGAVICNTACTRAHNEEHRLVCIKHKNWADDAPQATGAGAQITGDVGVTPKPSYRSKSPVVDILRLHAALSARVRVHSKMKQNFQICSCRAQSPRPRASRLPLCASRPWRPHYYSSNYLWRGRCLTRARSRPSPLVRRPPRA